MNLKYNVENEFKYDDKTISFKELYKYLERGESPFESLNYSPLFIDYDIYTLLNIYDDSKIFYFSKNKYIVKIKDSYGKEEKFDVLSSYEVNKIVEHKNINNIYFKDKKFCVNVNYFAETTNEKIIEFYFDKDEYIELTNNNEIFIINPKINVKPENLSKYYSLYFNDDLNEEISFSLTKERVFLFNEINTCFNINNIFKFTGPSGIGKSFFLLYYSRMTLNKVYINLGALRKLKSEKKYNQIKNLISEEFKRVRLEENEIYNFNKKMKEISPNINEIITFLIKFSIENQKNIVIILDQFKGELEFDKFKLNKVKLIICSTINDKNIRPSCISFFKNIFNKKQNNYENYIYIETLYYERNLNNKLFNYFGNIPKYISKIKNCKKKKDYFLISNEIKNKIINNIKAFYLEKNFYECLLEIKIHLNKFFSINDFDNIIPFFPLKYFKVSFYDEEENGLYFNELSKAKSLKLSYLFTFLSEIFEDFETELQSKFFKEGLFKKYTDSTIGGFFELVSINAVKSGILKLPEYPIQNILQVSIICDMNEIKPTLIENISKIFDEKIEEFEMFPKKNNEDQNTNILFTNLSQSIQNSFKNKFIYSENSIIKIKNDYIKSFDSLVICDDENKVLYSSKNSNTINKSTTIHIKNKNHNIKDQNILIKQERENAKIYDLAYLYGPSKSKIFIGFQMKSYRDYINRGSFKLNKKEIINKSKQLLLNSEFLLGVEIIEWHYFVVGLYFNEQDSKNFEIPNYSENLINFCKINNFELILFDPIQEVFYDSNKKKIVQFNTTQNSKLGGEEIKFFKFSEKNNFLGKKKALERCIESEKMMNAVLKYKINSNIFFSTMEKIINDLKEKLKLSNLHFIGERNHDKNSDFVPIPNDNIIILFMKNNLTDENYLNQFYAFIKYQNEEKSYVYDIKTGKKIYKDFEIQYFDLFNLNQPYYIFTFMEFKKN